MTHHPESTTRGIGSDGMTDGGTGYVEMIAAAVDYLRERGLVHKPDAALIFGSGLGEIAGCMKIEIAIPYTDIPGFVATTLDFHKGRFLYGEVSGRKVVAMDGRFHFYEGYTMKEITFPVRVMQRLGAGVLMISNIAGGLNPEFRAGDLVAITDHINFMGANPLIGPNHDDLGPRFPDMMEPYDHRLIEIVERHAMRKGVRLPRGVYLALTGPVFETRAEYRMLRNLGADLVGMSSVPEVIAAVHGGMRVMTISLVSDECFPECLQPLDVEVLLGRASGGSRGIADLFAAVLGDGDFDRVVSDQAKA